MNEPDEGNLRDGSRRRFDVELFIVHPKIDPAEITAKLGLEGSIIHRVGDRRSTPDGLPLKGTYPDTRWRYSVTYEVNDQFFAHKIRDLVERLVPHRQFLHDIRSTGGRTVLIVQFLGDGYLGDEIAADTLTKAGDLQLDFGVECFATSQGESTRHWDRRYTHAPVLQRDANQHSDMDH